MQHFTAMASYIPTLISISPYIFAGILTGSMPALAALPPLPVAAVTTTAALAGPTVTIPTITQLELAAMPTPPVAVQAPLSMPAEMFLGEELVPKIQALEFVEMHNLMPESWLAEATGLQVSEPGKCCAVLAKPRHPLVMDILIWAHCYGAMVGVLSARFRQAVPTQSKATVRAVCNMTRHSGERQR